MKMQMWLVGKNKSNPQSVIFVQSGFTLLELLVVLSIIVLIYGLSFPIYSKMMPTAALNSKVEKVISDLRRARLSAILSGKPVTFILEEKGEGYSVPELKINQQTDDIIFSFLVKQRQEIYFTPDGKNDGFTLLLNVGAREKGITSDWVTGRISMVASE